MARRPLRPVFDIDAEVNTRLSQYEPVFLPSVSTNPRANIDDDAYSAQQLAVLKEMRDDKRVKTAHFLLVMYLNQGNDPPDYIRIEPCAKLECWTDPIVAQVRFNSRGSGAIAEALEKQYRTFQKGAVCRKVVEGSIDDAKSQMSRMRRDASGGRVLFHYNGHGMPSATAYPEIWFFDKEHKNYVPYSMASIVNDLRGPAIFVLDCNSAGSMLLDENVFASKNGSDIFALCACSPQEMLPMNPLLPADILTSCLTTPVKMALEWYISFSNRKALLPNVTEDMIRQTPGDLNDRKTPLGELNWILTSITDTVAWCTTPERLFHSIFRQDVVVRSLFRNFLLADKILREVGCTPVSRPALPDLTSSHYMWDAWEVALESVLAQLPLILTNEKSYKQTTFLGDQLTAFEVWVEEGDTLDTPEQLPCVVRALTVLSHRVRALVLLSRYLATGPTAVYHTVRCGAMPYLTRLLLNTQEVLLLLTIVWQQIVAMDTESACQELIRYNAENVFIRLLAIESKNAVYVKENEHRGDDTRDSIVFYQVDGLSLENCKAATCYILCKMMDYNKRDFILKCWNKLLLKSAYALVDQYRNVPLLQSWGCLLLSKVFLGLQAAKDFIRNDYSSQLKLFWSFLGDRSPLVRASCATMLASLIGCRIDVLDHDSQVRQLETDRTILIKLRGCLFEHSSEVRQEVAYVATRFLLAYGALLPDQPLSKASILSVYRGGTPEWMAHEANILVTSVLTDSRPTDNPVFKIADSVKFNTIQLHSDTELPSFPPNPSLLCEESVEILQSLYHDVCVILAILHSNCDGPLVSQYIDGLNRKETPKSVRMDSELSSATVFATPASVESAAASSPLGATAVSSTCTATTLHREEDRKRRSRNGDIMRKLTLDNQEKKFDPPTAATTSSVAGSSPGLGNAAAAANSPSDAAATAWFTQPLFPVGSPSSILSHPSCAQFRLLEAQVVIADRKHCVSVIEYENVERNACVLRQFEHPTQIHEMHLLNDLAVDAGLLVLNSVGVFSIYRFNDILAPSNHHHHHHPQQAPKIATSFVACPSSTSLNIRAGYRSDGYLAYCGPTNMNPDTGGNELTLVNLVEEQVAQKISMPGNANVTALSVHPTRRTMIVGLSDGVVKCFDDRMRNGTVSAMSNVVQPRNPRGGGPEPILSLSHYDDQPDSSSVVVSSASAIRIFDMRKYTKSVEFSTMLGSTAHAVQHNGAVFTGLLSIAFADGSLDLLNHKLESVLPKGLLKPASHSSQDVHNGAWVHPLRPIALLGNEFVRIN